MKNSGMVQTPNGPQVPTAAQIQSDLNTVLTNLMQIFRANRVDGFTITSIGKILSQLKFDGTQTPTEIQLIVTKVAGEQAEEMRIFLLRQSVITTPIN